MNLTGGDWVNDETRTSQVAQIWRLHVMLTCGANVRDPCIWLFRFMQYGVMLAIRTLPPGLSEPVVKRFTDMLVKARGGLPAA